MLYSARKGVAFSLALTAFPLARAFAADACLTVADTEIKKVLLTSDLVNPMELAIAPDKRIFMVEKVSGKVRIFDPATSQLTDALTIPVYSPTHEGLLGIALDPGFASNHFVYVYYTHKTDIKHELDRYTEVGGKLEEASKKVVLNVPGVRWADEHHSSGSLAFAPDGNLFLSVGENVDPNQSQGYASVNEAKRLEDTQATAANSNDLNGKILRIHPEQDGSYTLPDGNLFKATDSTRGEIYAMGMRNPIRIAVDAKTGWLYWGEPGPDATTESATRGPIGRDEINRAKAPGFFGWPYFIAENLSYITGGKTQDPLHPVNNSPNNTGEKNLPPAQPPLLAYADAANAKYPAFESNDARASIMGGVYRFNAALTSARRLPPRFDGSLFIMDWSRDWINEVTFTDAGEVAAVAPFLKSQRPNGPIDMAFGPDGDMFLLEYDAHALYRVDYTGACKMDGTTGLAKAYGHEAGPARAVAAWIPSDGRLSAPAGARRLEIFNLRGMRVWQTETLSRSGMRAWTDVPSAYAGRPAWVRWE